jgi:hypothetical protein
MKYRPKIEEYYDFMDEFSFELSRSFPGVCFGYFGSFDKKRAVYGISDIDGFLIMDSGIVSDKRTVKGLSQILARALSNNPIPLHFNLLDLGTISDGRFMSYTADFNDYLKRGAKIVCGPHYHFGMNGIDFKSGVLDTASFNFSGPGGVRNTALYSLDLLQRDYDGFADRIESAIDKVAKFPKKLIWLRSGKIVPGRRESQGIIQRNLHSVDYARLDEINGVLDDASELDLRLEDPEEALRLLYSSLTVMEQMILAYITKYPSTSRREARG